MASRASATDASPSHGVQPLAFYIQETLYLFMADNPAIPPTYMEARDPTSSSQASGLVVVTGVFDLLHIGHLLFLEAARSQGDALIIGVESDERVRRWKGPNRPIQSQNDRAALLAALRIVDRCFIVAGERVDPDYYAELLRPLNPLYLAVTADDPFLAVKRDAMRAIGVELRVVTPRIENHSTTRLVRLLGLA